MAVETEPMTTAAAAAAAAAAGGDVQTPLEQLTAVVPMAVLVPLALLAGAFLLSCAVLAARFLKLRPIPGPIPLPFIGTAHLWSYSSWARLRRQHGPVYTMWLFHKPTVVIAEPEAVRYALTNTKAFPKGTAYSHIFGVAFGEGLVTSGTEKHKKDRAILSRFFVRSNLEEYVGVMNTETCRMMKEWLVPRVGQDVDVQKEFFHVLTLRVFCKFSMGFDVSEMPDFEKASVVGISGASVTVSRFMVLQWEPRRIWPNVRRLQDFVQHFHQTMWDHVVVPRQERMKRGEEVPDDCLNALLTSEMTKKEICEHITTLIGAGHDTTAGFCCFMCYLLACHPEAQDRLREELNSVLGDRTTVTKEDLPGLTYMRNVMQETLRLYAVIPNLQRTTSMDVKVKGTNFTIPKGTDVLIPFHMMNRDPTIWENPSQFRPERFESITHNSAKLGFLPFGYGSRTCIGNTLAIMECSVIFAHLLRNYQITPIKGFKPVIVGGISMSSNNGIHVKFEPREQAQASS